MDIQRTENAREFLLVNAWVCENFDQMDSFVTSDAGTFGCRVDGILETMTPDPDGIHSDASPHAGNPTE